MEMKIKHDKMCEVPLKLGTNVYLKDHELSECYPLHNNLTGTPF